MTRDTTGGEHLIEGTGELAVTISDNKPKGARAFTQVHQQFRAYWVVQAPVGLEVRPNMCTRCVWISMTNKTYKRLRKTVSTYRKSHAKMPEA